MRVSLFFTVMDGPSAAKDNTSHPDVVPIRSISPAVSFVLSSGMCAPINIVSRVPRQKAITRAEAATRITHKVRRRCILAMILDSSSPTDIVDSVHDISPHEAVHTNTPHPNIRR